MKTSLVFSTMIALVGWFGTTVHAEDTALQANQNCEARSLIVNGQVQPATILCYDQQGNLVSEQPANTEQSQSLAAQGLVQQIQYGEDLGYYCDPNSPYYDDSYDCGAWYPGWGGGRGWGGHHGGFHGGGGFEGGHAGGGFGGGHGGGGHGH